MDENTQNIQQPISQQQALPNATAVLVLGILSIVACWCYGIVGIILGVIALILSGKSKKLYDENPGAYTEGSYNNLKAGKICAIIGLSLSALTFIYFIFVIAIGLTSNQSFIESIIEQSQNMH